MFSSLGKNGPQVVFTGHDHVAAFVKHPDFDIGFIQAGHGGLSNGALSKKPPVVPDQGYISEDDTKDLLDKFISDGYSPKPPSGVSASAKYNPDVNHTKFYSDLNGFVLVTVNKTWMRVDYYFVNCSGLYTACACSSDVLGPVYSKYFPAKAVAEQAASGSSRAGFGAVLLGLFTFGHGQFF